ncbi:MAG: SusE domain-containing protein, partial [Bacteroidota bacterium]
MKKYILTFLSFAVLMTACQEKDLDPVVDLGAVPTITVPAAGSTFTLDSNSIDNIITTFEWTAADFGYQAGITYSVEVDAAGNNFADPVSLGSSNSLTYEELTVGRLNNILLAKGLPFGFDNELELRVCATVSDLVDPLCSEAVAVRVNPFQAAVVYPKLTVPGDYQGWAPDDETTAVYSRKSDDIYEGYIYFDVDSAMYKFAQGLSWDTNWGDNEMDGVLDFAGIDNNIPINEGKGMYLIMANLNDLSHSNQLTNWGLLGSATAGGTSTDEDLVWDEARGVLSITTDLGVGGIRFRANDADDINFGDDFSNGTLEYDGEDIPVAEAGNYTIDLVINVS